MKTIHLMRNFRLPPRRRKLRYFWLLPCK